MLKCQSVLFVAALFSSAVSPTVALAGAPPSASGPSHFSYEGRLTDSSGNPSQQVVSFFVRVYDPSGTCLLREEQTANMDLSATNGFFSITLGGTTTAADPGLSFASIFLNSTAMTGAASCSYTPSTGDGRLVRILVYDGTTTTAMQPDVPLGSSPYAMAADTLQGLSPSSFILANTTSGKTLSQTNLESIFASSANYNNLLSLVGGTNPNGASQIPSFGGNPASPTAGQIWYNSATNQLMLYNGTTSVAVSGNGNGWTTSGGNLDFTTGNVGVGTASPIAALDVAANVSGSAGMSYGSRITTQDSTSGSGGYTGLLVNVNTSGGGSGPKNSLDVQTNGASTFTVGSGGILASSSMTTSISAGTAYTPSSGISNPTGGAENYISDSVAINGAFAGLGLQVKNSSGNFQNSYILAVSQPGASVYGSATVFGNQSGIGSYFERMRIDSTGHVGIGNSAPIFPLDVMGAVNSTTSYDLGGVSVLSVPTGTSNFAVGPLAAANLTGASQFNTAVGISALTNGTGPSYDTAVGTYAMAAATTASADTAIGYKAGNGQTTGTQNTMVGYLAGGSVAQTGSLNILIGYMTDTPVSNSSGFLNIGNVLFGSGMTGTYALGAGKIGVGTTSPMATLDIAGQFRTSGTSAAISACGSSPSITGTDQSGVLTVGSGSVTSCTVSFHAALTAVPGACILMPGNATAAATATTVAYVSGITAAGWTFAGSALAGAVYYYHCY